MPTFVRSFTKRIFIGISILLVVVFLLACCNIWLNPQEWWWVAVLGLGFPFILLAVICCLVFWLIFKSRWAILPFVALLLGYSNIRALIGVHFSASFNKEKAPNSLRILSWNVSWFDNQRKSDKNQKSRRKEMLEYIASQNADVLCFQEYLESNIKDDEYSNEKEFSAMGYPYNYWVGDYILKKGTYLAGTAIFSKYPIIKTFRLQYNGERKDKAFESLIAADLDLGKDTIRVFTTHLQSILLKDDDYKNIEVIRNVDDSMVAASKSILRKLKNGYKYRGGQAQMVREELDKSPYPEIICGDFNDVPNSYTYFTIKGPRQDAFLEKGSRFGRTYNKISPTLRIDYIMPNARFKVLQYTKTVLPYSDHFPIMADLQFP
ncbi:MAG: endonuclease/exonuclease/phosphatase family protein [Chitinophagaceae bacterium]|nr:endonuclease/exonuclease/phosphatase family protein [Chitinophagaceae bacterium]